MKEDEREPRERSEALVVRKERLMKGRILHLGITISTVLALALAGGASLSGI